MPDEDFGGVRMQNVRSGCRTPGAIRFAGRGHAADTDAVLAGLDPSTKEIAARRGRNLTGATA